MVVTRKPQQDPRSTKPTPGRTLPLAEDDSRVHISFRYEQAKTHLLALYCLAMRQGSKSPEAKRLQVLFKAIPSVIEDGTTGASVKCAILSPKEWGEFTPQQKKLVGELITELFENSRELVHRFHQIPIEQMLGAVAGMMQETDQRKELIMRLPVQHKVEMGEVISRMKEAKPFFSSIEELHVFLAKEFPYNSLSVGFIRFIADNY
jgi:hypothetical protein